MQITDLKPYAERALGPDPWDDLNGVLYRFCHENPKHDDPNSVLAKIVLIGRTYSAALERRKKLPNEVGDFYIDNAVPKIIGAKIDQQLSVLSGIEEVPERFVERILEVHGSITQLFFDISGRRKRSLASKYLHFHFPSLFFIFDSNASTAIRRIEPKPRIRCRTSGSIDKEYSWFYRQCLWLREEIHQSFRCRLNPRQLDNLLFLIIAAEQD